MPLNVGKCGRAGCACTREEEGGNGEQRPLEADCTMVMQMVSGARSEKRGRQINSAAAVVRPSTVTHGERSTLKGPTGAGGLRSAIYRVLPLHP